MAPSPAAAANNGPSAIVACARHHSSSSSSAAEFLLWLSSSSSLQLRLGRAFLLLLICSRSVHLHSIILFVYPFYKLHYLLLPVLAPIYPYHSSPSPAFYGRFRPRNTLVKPLIQHFYLTFLLPALLNFSSRSSISPNPLIHTYDHFTHSFLNNPLTSNHGAKQQSLRCHLLRAAPATTPTNLRCHLTSSKPRASYSIPLLKRNQLSYQAVRLASFLTCNCNCNCARAASEHTAPARWMRTRATESHHSPDPRPRGQAGAGAMMATGRPIGQNLVIAFIVVGLRVCFCFFYLICVVSFYGGAMHAAAGLEIPLHIFLHKALFGAKFIIQIQLKRYTYALSYRQ